jgi:membrane protein
MLNKILVSIIELIQKTRRDDIFAISAQFSYYIILSVFPFLILTISAFS